MAASYDALFISPQAVEMGGLEVLRAGIAEGGLHCTLRPAFSNVEAWGYLLADVVHHVADSYREQFQMDPAEVMQKIRDGFNESMEKPRGEGSTVPITS